MRKDENRKGSEAPDPLHTLRAFFRVLDCGGRKVVDLCLYAAIVSGWTLCRLIVEDCKSGLI